MKKKRTRKPLKLAKKTLRTLTEVDLDLVVGGSVSGVPVSGAQTLGIVPTNRNC